MRAIDADSDNAGGPTTGEADTLNEDSSAFRASRHQIIWPLEADVGCAEVLCRARQRHAGDETELSRLRRRTGIDHEGAGVKVALPRDPGPAAAAPPRGLFIGDDP